MGDAGDDRIHGGKCDDTLIGGSKGAGAVAKDVSFLAGRQAERDRATEG